MSRVPVTVNGITIDGSWQDILNISKSGVVIATDRQFVTDAQILCDALNMNGGSFVLKQPNWTLVRFIE